MVLSTLEIEQSGTESETAPLLSFLGVKKPSPTNIKLIAAAAASTLLVLVAAVVVRLPGHTPAASDTVPADSGVFRDTAQLLQHFDLMTRPPTLNKNIQNCPLCARQKSLGAPETPAKAFLHVRSTSCPIHLLMASIYRHADPMQF